MASGLDESAPHVSIVVPCYNEENSVRSTLDELTRAMEGGTPYEIIFVNDGSSDRTGEILATFEGIPNVRTIAHEANRGYGAALKTGIRNARARLIAITDADGTYPNDQLPDLVARCADRDMVVGARTGQLVIYSKLRAFPKYFLKKWVSYLARQKVPDINSGMRVFRKDLAESFFGILPNSFSFTITITLASLTTYRNVEFVPINYAPREGKSKIKPIRDTLRFMKIILRTGVYFAPVRAFLPIFLMMLAMTVLSLVYDVAVLDDLTDKTVLMFLFLLMTGMFILIADMIDKRLSR